MSVPKTITLQTDWFPEAEYGAYFSLIGAKGTLDAKKGTYTGPLGKTGVNLSDPCRRPVHRSADGAVADVPGRLDHPRPRAHRRCGAVQQAAPDRVGRRAARAQPARARLGSEEAQLQLVEASIGKSGAKILVFTKAVNYVPFLIAKGLVPESSFDDSFDGSYSRFVADTSLLQQAFVTETPYRLKQRDQGVRA